MSTPAVIGLAIFGIAFLLGLVVFLRLHASVALLLTSLVVAVLGGIPLAEIGNLIQLQMGSTLGYIAVVIGLGAMFGEMLQRSGGASAIANRLLRVFGERKATWALAFIGLVVATPVFFDVALVLLMPLVASVTRRSHRSLLFYALPLLAGIAVAHAFIPPTPGPVAVAGLLGADLGWVIALGLLCGIPATLIGGILWGRLISERVQLEIPEFLMAEPEHTEPSGTRRDRPGFGIAFGLVALPLALILLGTGSRVVLDPQNPWRDVLGFLGHPFVALLIATLLSFYALGIRLGFTPTEVRDMATQALQPVGLIILVTGAGGVFGKVLVETGVGEVVADWLADSKLPLVVLAFLIAAAVRIAQGSATVSMVTAAGLVAPIVEASDLSAPGVAAVVIAIASGASVMAHVNDSGFWLVGRYLGMSEQQTLRVWTVAETLLGVTGFLTVLLLTPFL